MTLLEWHMMWQLLIDVDKDVAGATEVGGSGALLRIRFSIHAYCSGVNTGEWSSLCESDMLDS